MKRLDEIPKKTLFEVPEGYFEKLPGRIQDRIRQPEPEAAWGRLALRYALPVAILAAATLFVVNNRPELSPEQMIAGIDSEQLVAYLEDIEITTDDLLDNVTFDISELESLETDALDGLVIDETVIDAMEVLEDFDSVENKK